MIALEKVETLVAKLRKINECANGELNTILIGDFNAHTGESLELEDLQPRLNCDVKKNARGCALLTLCRDTRHIILNGRSTGDLMGQYLSIRTLSIKVRGTKVQ